MSVTDVLTIMLAFGSFVLLLVDLMLKLIIFYDDNQKNDHH
ncbi:putative holin-like toxin [Schleiferilactobacillus harbinensis]|uniref:Holin n=1 Tax=Schleiferilactobacillus harbinensis TaxID=304207 RepID=A0A5P8M860_9LACO|nr:putative holin-like toxin [Schleiferilactobacillus harbinensis]QFR24722.1 holin [Schleiferilactobacillus harbinensis]